MPGDTIYIDRIEVKGGSLQTVTAIAWTVVAEYQAAFLPLAISRIPFVHFRSLSKIVSVFSTGHQAEVHNQADSAYLLSSLSSQATRTWPGAISFSLSKMAAALSKSSLLPMAR